MDPEAVVIIAVAHLRKQPGYWRKELSRAIRHHLFLIERIISCVL
jgi:hypothetical protein